MGDDGATLDSGPLDSVGSEAGFTDAPTTDLITDASSAPDAAAACPLLIDRVTLRAVSQSRHVGLPNEQVDRATSDDLEVAVVEVDGDGARVRAVAAGNARVSLEGAHTSAFVDVEVQLDDSIFVTEVVEVTYGEGAGFGQAGMPAAVLGPPQGRGELAGSLDVVSLGLGGTITVALGVDVVDGPGVDLIVFENPFIGFLETGRVEVSLDGELFVAFDCAPQASEVGCAGHGPVWAHQDNDLDPTDPALAGGDPFDLADVGLPRARFVRITDVGGMDTGGGMAGFDLDAVVAVNAVPRSGFTLASPETAALHIGEEGTPRLDLSDGVRTIFGVPARCAIDGVGPVELSCGCRVRALAAGAATLTARLGDLQTTTEITVTEE